MTFRLTICVCLLLTVVFGCRNHPPAEQSERKAIDTLFIYAVSNFSKPLLLQTQQELAKHFKCIKAKTIAQLPTTAYYAARKRYIADSIISYFAKQTPTNAVSILLTHFDISTKKGTIPNYGIMGLGFCPGRACVVSSFRLKKENLHAQFYKLCLHELGHTAGLPHCKVQTCFMRDAEGKNHFDEESGFCSNCKTYLNKKAWNLE